MKKIKDILMCYIGIKRTIIHYFYFMKTQKELIGYYKYWFHDWDKILMYLFIPFIGKSNIRKIHQKYNKHHIRDYKPLNKIDCLEAIIDWESSKYKSYSYSLNAWEYFKKHKIDSKYSPQIIDEFININYEIYRKYK